MTTLNPLSPEIISRQATINIGTIGHVAHGKSTVVKALSGVKTVRFQSELERNITIKLGYANAKIYKCPNPNHPPPSCYKSFGSTQSNPKCDQCNCELDLLRHVSFVDCPGHDILMATMLNGAAVMDAALLLVAGNESCPQPQTLEHLAAVEIMKLENIIILQNKVDLAGKEATLAQHTDILQFIKGTVAENCPIIPISAQFNQNIDVLCEYIANIPVPIRDFDSAPRMTIIRSFDVNKPGVAVEDLKGGIAGGSIIHGILRVGDEIEIRPGIVTNGTCSPILSRVTSLFAEENDLDYAVPGGLIGVGTNIDPTFCRADRLVGQLLGIPGTLPDIFTELEINFYLLHRLLGTNAKEQKQVRVGKIKKGEVLMLNIGSMTTGAKVLDIKKDLAKLTLVQPVCAIVNEKIALSRRIDKHWRLIGWGKIMSASKNVCE